MVWSISLPSDTLMYIFFLRQRKTTFTVIYPDKKVNEKRAVHRETIIKKNVFILFERGEKRKGSLSSNNNNNNITGVTSVRTMT